MSNYRRVRLPGGCYFFTHNLRDRSSNLLTKQIPLFRASVAKVKANYPFRILAWVVLPDHFHCMIGLPEDDDDFPIRWRLIKGEFAKQLNQSGVSLAPGKRKGESGFWQRRYWEHLIRDERDYQAHFDYIHINPLKHGLVERVQDWPYSTFHRYIQSGMYPADWAGSQLDKNLDYVD